MNPRNLVEAFLPIGIKLRIAEPVVEARFVDGDELMVSILANSPHDLNVKIDAALTLLLAKNVTPKKGNVLYASGYRLSFADDDQILLSRQELGTNADGGLRAAWAFLGEVQESGQD